MDTIGGTTGIDSHRESIVIICVIVMIESTGSTIKNGISIMIGKGR